METATIYASYGVLAHEHETLWGVAPYEGACDADRVAVSLPDGYYFCENSAGEVLIEDDEGDTTTLVGSLVKIANDPYLIFPKGTSWTDVPLSVVSREGLTVR